jgi:hypothetical protein
VTTLFQPYLFICLQHHHCGDPFTGTKCLPTSVDIRAIYTASICAPRIGPRFSRCTCRLSTRLPTTGSARIPVLLRGKSRPPCVAIDRLSRVLSTWHRLGTGSLHDHELYCRSLRRLNSRVTGPARFRFFHAVSLTSPVRCQQPHRDTRRTSRAQHLRWADRVQVRPNTLQESTPKENTTMQCAYPNPVCMHSRSRGRSCIQTRITVPRPA